MKIYFLSIFEKSMELKTKRLTIRPVKLSDAEDLFVYRSNPAVSTFLSAIHGSLAETKEFITQGASEINTQGTWFQLALLETENQQLVGDVGLHFLERDPLNAQVEIGYTLDEPYWGKGYAKEALSRIIEFLFTDLKKHRIIAGIDPRNVPSIRLVESLGFRKEGHFKESFYLRGEWVDDYSFALLASEWNR